ncbi:hypothetical protein [Streptomyces sp. NPDC049813]
MTGARAETSSALPATSVIELPFPIWAGDAGPHAPGPSPLALAEAAGR